MITVDYVRTMARYNAWQNEAAITACNTLTDEERRADRGAFFKSIHATMSHLMWGDMLWMHRFADTPKPMSGIRGSVSLFPDWHDLCQQRTAFDATILAWADGLEPDWLKGDLRWFSNAGQREFSKPKGFLVTHFFNHQTHHRGQIHAMLTSAGAATDDTDLFFLPD